MNLPGMGRALVFRRGGKAIGSMCPIETVFPIKSPSEGQVHSSVRASDHHPVSATIGISWRETKKPDQAPDAFATGVELAAPVVIPCFWRLPKARKRRSLFKR